MNFWKYFHWKYFPKLTKKWKQYFFGFNIFSRKHGFFPYSSLSLFFSFLHRQPTLRLSISCLYVSSLTQTIPSHLTPSILLCHTTTIAPPHHYQHHTISDWQSIGEISFMSPFFPFFCFMSPWVFYVLLIFLMGMMILHFRLSSFFLFFPFLFFLLKYAFPVGTASSSNVFIVLQLQWVLILYNAMNKGPVTSFSPSYMFN